MIITKTVRFGDLGLELRLFSTSIDEASTQSLSLDRMVLIAKSYCPVDTGALMASIRAERRGPLEAALIAGGGYINPRTLKPVDYAKHVHDGTSRVPPQPFLLQAILAERLRLAQEIIERSGGLMS
jgi:hypothetical protein